MIAEEWYRTLRLVHILGGVFLIGHWVSLALWKMSADRSGDARAAAMVSDRIFTFDRRLTGPLALVVFVAGYVIIRPGGYFGGKIGASGWAVWGLVLFFVAMLIWFVAMRPAEVRMADLADRAVEKGENLGAEYRRASVGWLVAVALAVAAGLAAAALMVFKPALWPS